MTIDLLGNYSATVADCAAAPTSEDVVDPGSLEQPFTCVENADVAVTFNVTVMRPAQLGFFDIAVNFGDIFCSAKVDCCNDDEDGICDEDLTLLHDATGERRSTVVVGFACGAGDPATDTFLYMSDVEIVCGDPGATQASIIPHGQGNLCDVTTGTCTGVTTTYTTTTGTGTSFAH